MSIQYDKVKISEELINLYNKISGTTLDVLEITLHDGTLLNEVVLKIRVSDKIVTVSETCRSRKHIDVTSKTPD